MTLQRQLVHKDRWLKRGELGMECLEAREACVDSGLLLELVMDVAGLLVIVV